MRTRESKIQPSVDELEESRPCIAMKVRKARTGERWEVYP